MWGQVAAHWSSDWGAHAVILQSEGAVSKSFYIYIIRLHFLILLYIYHSSPSSPLFETSIYISFVSIVSTFWNFYIYIIRLHRLHFLNIYIIRLHCLHFCITFSAWLICTNKPTKYWQSMANITLSLYNTIFRN